MIELGTSDAPGILCLQEVPVWALSELELWSGMRLHAMVARPARRPAVVSAAITRLHRGFFRSRLAGQANAILVDSSLTSHNLGGIQVSEPGRERRIVQAARVVGVGVIGNLHATNAPSTPALAASEVARAGGFLDGLAEPGEPRILAGDLNLRDPTLRGYEGEGSGVDHILVAESPAGRLVRWEGHRRVQNGRVLSDHAPVERVVG